MNPTIKAPWDDATVLALAKYQDVQPMHPYTCPNVHTKTGGPTTADLVPTKDGWICGVHACDYTQDWAHDFTIEWGHKLLKRDEEKRS